MMPGRPIAIRDALSAGQLRRQARRAGAVALALGGGRRIDVARAIGIHPSTLRRWVAKFNTSGIFGLVDCQGQCHRRESPAEPAVARSVRTLPKAVQPQTRLQTAAVARRAG